MTKKQAYLTPTDQHPYFPPYEKNLERRIADCLTWYLESNQLINNDQSGFRGLRSVIDHIIELQDSINKALANKHHTLGVFLDFQKAFDLFWGTGDLLN